jgi:hypothetical protein
MLRKNARTIERRRDPDLARADLLADDLNRRDGAYLDYGMAIETSMRLRRDVSAET